MKPETALLKARLETKLGLKLARCRTLPGSMRPYVGIAVPWSGSSAELHGWLARQLGFAPFYCGSNYDGTFTADIEIRKLEAHFTL